jgi:TP901 family phage tail tape measure protein
MPGQSEYKFVLTVDGSQGIAATREFKATWNKEMGDLGKPMSSAQQWAAMKEGANVVANGLLAVGAAGAAAGVASVKMAADFDGAMRNVNSIAQLSESQFQSLKSEVLDFTLTSRASSTDVAAALYNVVSAGMSLEKAVEVPVTKVRELADGSKELYTETLKTSEAMAVMNIASHAAGAGLASTEDTSRLLISALRAYNLDVSQAGRVTDLFLYTVQKGLLRLPDLASELGSVFPAAHAAGISLEEVTASEALLTQKGLSAAEAATALNMAITDVLNPSDALAEVFHKAGYESGIAAVHGLGWAGVMQLVSRATGGANDKVGELFGNMWSQRAVFNLMTDGAKELSAAVKDFGENSAGAVEKARIEQYKSLSANLEKLRNAAEVTAITMGDLFLPSIVEAAVDLTKGIQDLGKAFRALPEGEQQRWVNIGLGITGAALAIGTLIKVAISAIDTYNKLTAAVRAYQAAAASGGLVGKVGGGIGAAAAPAAMTAGVVVGANLLERAALPDYERRVEQGEKIRAQAQELAAALAEEAKGTGDLSEKSKALAEDLQLTMRAAERTGIAWTDYEPKISAIRSAYENLKGPGDAVAASMGNLQQFDSALVVHEVNELGNALENAATQAKLGKDALEALGKSGVSKTATYDLWKGLGPMAGAAPEVPEKIDLAAEYRKQAEEMQKAQEDAMKEQQRLADEAAKEMERRRSVLLGIFQSSAQELLQPTGGFDALDLLDQQMGRYVGRWDDWGRMMTDVAQKGAESAWAGWANIPADVMAKGEETIKAWAQRQAQAFYKGMRPETIDWGDFVKNYQQMVTEKAATANMEAEAQHQIQQALGTGQIDMAVFKQAFGKAMGQETTLSPMLQAMLGDPSTFGAQIQGQLDTAMASVTLDPTTFTTLSAQVTTAFSGALSDGVSQVSITSVLMASIQADFAANLEAKIKPIVVPAGKQIGDWLGQGLNQSSFGAELVALVMEKLADAVKG